MEADSQGRPSAGTWQQREPVREVVNRWRVGDGWRRVPIRRTCYTVITPTIYLEVYCDDIAGDWYLQWVIG